MIWLLASPILSGQRLVESNASLIAMPSTWKVHQKSPDNYERDRVGKYVPYFLGNIILPIPDLCKALDPWILSLVVMDIKTRRLTGVLQRSPLHSGHPWPILLQAKLRHIGCAAACSSTGSKVSGELYCNQVLLAIAGTHGDTKDLSDGL